MSMIRVEHNHLLVNRGCTPSSIIIRTTITRIMNAPGDSIVRTLEWRLIIRGVGKQASTAKS